MGIEDFALGMRQMPFMIGRSIQMTSTADKWSGSCQQFSVVWKRRARICRCNSFEEAR